MKKVDSIYLGDGLGVEYYPEDKRVILEFGGETFTLHNLLFGSLLLHGETLAQRYDDPFRTRPEVVETPEAFTSPFPSAMTVIKALGGHPDDVNHERLSAERLIQQPGIITLLTRCSVGNPVLKYTALTSYSAPAMTVSIDNPEVIASSLPAYYRHSVGSVLIQWIRANQSALLDYWQSENSSAIRSITALDGLVTYKNW